MLRSPIFTLAAARDGVRVAAAAAATDVSYRLILAGVIGALVQRLATVRPPWLATTVAVVGVPLLAHSVEALVHWRASTPHWTDAFRLSVLMSVVSTLFNLYAMRRGALVAGEAGRSLADDLRRLPRLILGFLAHPLSARDR